MDFSTVSLSIVLFVVYFSIFSVVFTDTSTVEIKKDRNVQHDQFIDSITEMFDEVFSDSNQKEDKEIDQYGQFIRSNWALENDDTAKEQSIDVNRLTLRQARKVAKKLGIRQKVNGKDQPKRWIIGQIKQKLKDTPNCIKTIHEVLAA